MKIGVVFPETEIGNDPAATCDYAHAVEAMGYTHVLAVGHVVGANLDRPGGWKGSYTHRHAFHGPFVLFGLLAAATTRLELATGIKGGPPRSLPWRTLRRLKEDCRRLIPLKRPPTR